MKQVINGKVYDTHAATIVNHICVRHGAPHIVWFYRKQQNGEYFRVNHYYMAKPPRYEFELIDNE